MVGQTGHTPAQPGAGPARIELEDFIEALTLEAQDQVHRLRTGGTVAAPTDDVAGVANHPHVCESRPSRRPIA